MGHQQPGLLQSIPYIIDEKVFEDKTIQEEEKALPTRMVFARARDLRKEDEKLSKVNFIAMDDAKDKQVLQHTFAKYFFNIQSVSYKDMIKKVLDAEKKVEGLVYSYLPNGKHISRLDKGEIRLRSGEKDDDKEKGTQMVMNTEKGCAMDSEHEIHLTAKEKIIFKVGDNTI